MTGNRKAAYQGQQQENPPDRQPRKPQRACISIISHFHEDCKPERIIMQAIILTLGAFIAAGLLFSKQSPEGKPPPSRQRTDLDGISPHIERAAHLLDSIHELDDLLTSADLCAPMERAQALSLEWTNHSGSHHKTKLWMDGTGSTQAIRAAATEERERLRTALLEEIRAAYLRECVTGTDTATPSGNVTETTREGGAV